MSLQVYGIAQSIAAVCQTPVTTMAQIIPPDEQECSIHLHRNDLLPYKQILEDEM